ncbi:hypothetical protein HK098_008369 [Nowakowskiella sp. JEL0407]|nr:hypothetical protein HK098_008369 [Nowakowskiella sp. JEL0407]
MAVSNTFPKQAPGRFPFENPFPAWHPLADFMTAEPAIVSFIWQFIVCALCTVAAIVLIYNSRGKSNLNATLAFYIFGTCGAIASFIFFDSGKSFSILGVLHNTGEVVLLLLFVTGGKLKNWILPFTLFYYSIVIALIIVFPWPFDAVWFKIQGLISDFALIIHFYNLLIANKHSQTTQYLPVNTNSTNHTNGISTLIGNVSSAIGRRDSSEEENETVPEEIGVSLDEATSWTRFYFPLAAAFIHAFGNTPTTMFGKSAFWYDLFLFSYGVAYPLYTYFIYLNIKAEDSKSLKGRVVWPEYTKFDHVKIFVVSLILDLIVMAFAAVNA